jgi:uncharacterized membrane protein
MIPFFTQLFTPFFHNPAMVAPGLALIASPIIIHLINRMRFRRVRFAAMEFLLDSMNRNRRRVLLEQLLLLLLRVLIVMFLVFLIARLVLSSDRLALLGGKKTHHVVLLDDSGSMRDRWGETSAFQEGLEVVTRIVEQGTQRPGTQKFTLILLSDPENPILPPQRDINDTLRTDLETKLDTLECSYRRLDLAAGLDSIRNLFGEKETKAYFNNLHIVSDFRLSDWESQQAIAEAIRTLDKEEITVNLVKTVPQRNENLAVTEFSGDLQVAAAGVPLRLKVKVHNLSETVAKSVGLSVFQDGRKEPFAIRFDAIEAGKEVEREFDIVLDTPAKHRLHVSLPDDALLADNTRYLAVDLSRTNHVLIIDGNPEREDAFYVSAALAADPNITGFSPLMESADYLRKHPLDQFQCIYLLNVPMLLPDAREAVEDYVNSGGGLAWFLGDAILPLSYNEQLHRINGESLIDGLFPVSLDTAFRELPQGDEFNSGPDISFTPHPIFMAFEGQDNPFVETVRIEKYRSVSSEWQRDDNKRQDGVLTIARLRNNQPLMLEHRYGQGRVITCLTSAGPMWNNWQKNPSYVPTFLELQKYIARDDRTLARRVVGQPIRLRLESATYTDDVEVRGPDNLPIRLKASLETSPPVSQNPPPGNNKAAENNKTNETPRTDQQETNPQLVVDYQATNLPGIYAVKLVRTDQTPEERWIAYNVPIAESDLNPALTSEIEKRLGKDLKGVTIYEPGDESLVNERDADYEVRRLLLFCLVGFLLGEQLLAYRLSYHPKLAGAVA